MRKKELKSIVSRIDTLLERAHQFTDSKKYDAIESLLIEYNSIEDHLHQNELIDLQNREYVIDVKIEDLYTATGDPSDKARMVLEKIILNLTNLRNQVKPGRKKIKNKTSKEVQVAQINARQAIIVALISGIFFIIVTLLSIGVLFDNNAKKNVKQEKQHWFGILNVKLSKELLIKGVRVIVEVNGRVFSYPTRAIWAEPNPEMSSEFFAVEISNIYKIRIELLTIDEIGDVNRFTSQKLDTISLSQIPIENTYHLYVSSSIFRSGSIEAWVRYKLSKRPD